MLTELRIGNFKAFGNEQRIPIRPITLVFGANSSGKSSLLNSLLLFQHAETKSSFREEVDAYFGPEWLTSIPDLDVYQPILAGNTVDLGGWRSYIHKRTIDRRVTLGLEVDLKNAVITEALFDLAGPDAMKPPKLEYVENLNKRFSSLSFLVSFGTGLPDDSRAGGAATKACAQSIEVSVDRTWLLRMRRRHTCSAEDSSCDSLPFEAVNLRHPFLTQSHTSPAAKKVLRNLVRDYECVTTFLPEAVKKTDQFAGDFPADPVGQLIFAVRRIAKTVSRSMRYLNGLRILPARNLLSFDRSDANYSSSGMDAWDRLVNEPELLKDVNDMLTRLGAPFYADIRATGDLTDLQLATRLRRGTSDTPPSALRRLKGALRKTLRAATRELFLVDRRNGTPVSHRDVGIGMSQVLPVLCNATGCSNSTILIEQPEVHLHPGLQSELGDVFIESALGDRKNTFLLETHSEHLVLRILRRVRETMENKLPEGKTPVRPEDVAVLYVQPGANGAEVIELPVTPDGDFGRPWPGGFFAERFQELP